MISLSIISSGIIPYRVLNGRSGKTTMVHSNNKALEFSTPSRPNTCEAVTPCAAGFGLFGGVPCTRSMCLTAT